MEAVDVLHGIERLVALAAAGPAAKPEVFKEAMAILCRMGLGNGASGYKAEKLAAVRDGLETWLSSGSGAVIGDDPNAFHVHLLADIEKLRKALARGSEGQD